MRRVGNLYERIADPENLRLAFWKASRGKRHRPDVAAFRERLGDGLAGLRRDLLAGAVRVGDYHYFTIRDPKERTICAAPFRERVLHHAVMNLCEPVFEAYQVHASYACRPGKGVHAAVARAWRHARAHRWHLKLDVRQYFASIDHGVLLRQLARRFKDRRLLDLFGRIIASYEAAPGKGVPIGNLTSQYFANHYLAVLDHFLQETLGVRGYVRYMPGPELRTEKADASLLNRAPSRPPGVTPGGEKKSGRAGRGGEGLVAEGQRSLAVPFGNRIGRRLERKGQRVRVAVRGSGVSRVGGMAACGRTRIPRASSG